MMRSNAPIGEFEGDKLRFEAFKLREQRLRMDTIGCHCVRLAVCVTTGIVMLSTDHPATIGGWFAMLIAMFRGGPSPT